MAGVNVSIDRRQLVPHHVPVAADIIPAGFSEHPLPGGGMVVFEELTPATIILKFGLPALTEEAQFALESIRTRAGGLHLLGLEDLSCHKFIYLNCYISRPPRNAMHHGDGDKLVFGDYDLVCKQVNLWPKLVNIQLTIPGVVALGDGQSLYDPPSGGRIVSVDGWIENSGSGGGQTRVQVSQQGTDFLSTPGDFTAGGAGVGASLSSQVLAGNTNFVRGFPLELDVDGLPGNADSSALYVELWLMLFCPV